MYCRRANLQEEWKNEILRWSLLPSLFRHSWKKNSKSDNFQIIKKVRMHTSRYPLRSRKNTSLKAEVQSAAITSNQDLRWVQVQSLYQDPILTILIIVLFAWIKAEGSNLPATSVSSPIMKRGSRTWHGLVENMSDICCMEDLMLHIYLHVKHASCNVIINVKKDTVRIISGILKQ